MNKRLFVLLAVFLTGFAGVAEANDPGRTVMAYLKIGIDARSAAMGDAYVSVADNASAAFWNPAGLLGIENMDATFMHNEWLLDLRHEFAAAGLRKGKHAFGVSFVGMFTGDLDRRDKNGVDEGTFGFSDNSLSGSYAYQVSEDFGMGGTIRYLREAINDYIMSGFAFDVGATWKTPIEDLTAGGALRNLGGELSYDIADAKAFELPTTMQVGANYRAGEALLLASDIVVTSGEDTSVHMGAEYTYEGYLSLGVGYKTGLDSEDVSFGVGYAKDLRFHYAFTPLSDDLGNSHRISVGYAW